MTLRLILAGDVNLMNVTDVAIPFRRVAAGLHAADAVFDDSVLADGVTLLAELALRTLAGRG